MNLQNIDDFIDRWKSSGASERANYGLFLTQLCDLLGVLREIIDPSHKIDPKFAVQVILTVDGGIVSGIVTSEDKDTISVVVNPEAPEPTIMKRDDIDEIEKSSNSLMPKALLDRFTRDEIFELLAYLEYAASPAKSD
jgi:putative heme-binding domain-containing protein